MSDTEQATKTSTPPPAQKPAPLYSDAKAKASDRDQFAVDELAIVLSHYDLGIIDSIAEFPRGSRRAPKLVVRTDKGTFLIKRRARGKDDAFKVAFAHTLQLFLASRQFPLPHLIGTRRDNNSMLQLNETIYEVFEFIRGTGYDSTPEGTHDSGKTLGLFHKLLRDYQPEFEPPVGTYHDAPSAITACEQIPRTFSKKMANYDSRSDEVQATVTFLRDSYRDAADRCNQAGLKDWPIQIIHSDWHPGNMLFRGPRVVAVIDYDASRLSQRIIDAANGALQFSIIGGGDNAETWPDHIDEVRFVNFIKGYDSVNMLSRAELRCVPWLMSEALIAEAVIPIAATGTFARMDGLAFLQMVERKVRWLREQSDRLIAALDG